MRLPIDIVQGTNPPRFKWIQVVNTPAGTQEVQCEGLALPSQEQAVVQLICQYKLLQAERDKLLRDNEDRQEQLDAALANVKKMRVDATKEERESLSRLHALPAPHPPAPAQTASIPSGKVTGKR